MANDEDGGGGGNAKKPKLTVYDGIVNDLNADHSHNQIRAADMLKSKKKYYFIISASVKKTPWGKRLTLVLKPHEDDADRDHILFLNSFFSEEKQRNKLIKLANETKSFISCVDIKPNAKGNPVPKWHFEHIDLDDDSSKIESMMREEVGSTSKASDEK